MTTSTAHPRKGWGETDIALQSPEHVKQHCDDNFPPVFKKGQPFLNAVKTWRRLQKLETRCWGTPNPRHLFLPTTDCVWWHGRFVYGAKEILLSLSIQRHDSSLRQTCASSFYENKHSSGFYLQYAWPSHHAMEQLFVRPTKAGTVRSCGWREGGSIG